MPGLLEADRWTVGLSRRVRVDVHALLRAMDTAPSRQRHDPSGLLSLLECEELLPGWYDDWVLYEREKLEQRKIRALENLATTAYDSGDLVHGPGRRPRGVAGGSPSWTRCGRS